MRRLEGRASADDEIEAREYLRTLDEKIELLKSNNELVRSQAQSSRNVIQLRNFNPEKPRVQAKSRHA